MLTHTGETVNDNEMLARTYLAVITDNASSQLLNRSQNFQKAVRKLQDVEDNMVTCHAYDFVCYPYLI